MAVCNEEPEKNARRGPKEPRADAIDHLSDLPDSIIVHILSFLETKDAVKTSVLSRRWKSHWTSVPTLRFCAGDFRLFSGFRKLLDKSLKHCHKLDKLRIGLSEFSFRQPGKALDAHINLWLLRAANRNVGTLHLELYRPYSLPDFLYKYSSLTELSTKSCNYEPKASVSWGSLRSLSIRGTRISKDAFTSILLGSPVLEHLELISCLTRDGLDVCSSSLKKLVLKDFWPRSDAVKISAPNLKSLKIFDCPFWEHFELLDVSALVEVSLNVSDYYIDARSRKKVLQQLHNVMHAYKVAVGDYICRVLSKAAVRNLSSFCNCLVLHVETKGLEHQAMNKLLQISPVLETLVIKIVEPVRSASQNFQETCWPSPERKKLVCLNRALKNVRVIGFEVESSMSMKVISFVEFLLKEAKALENLNIYSARGGSCTCAGKDCKLFKVAQKLLNFPRSSQSAVVGFHA